MHFSFQLNTMMMMMMMMMMICCSDDVRSVDDGQEIKVPVLLNGKESVMEFIDLPYSGVSNVRLFY